MHTRTCTRAHATFALMSNVHSRNLFLSNRTACGRDGNAVTFDLFPIAGPARGGGIDRRDPLRCNVANAVIALGWAMGLRIIRVASSTSYKYWYDHVAATNGDATWYNIPVTARGRVIHVKIVVGMTCIAGTAGELARLASRLRHCFSAAITAACIALEGPAATSSRWCIFCG